VVERIISDIGKPVAEVLQHPTLLKAVNAERYADERFGLPTVLDILSELEKPGRDPRPDFRAATFKAGVNELKDLQVDMVLEGVVTNVTNFGAFVDVGVHQDGLVHISALADHFVKDPHEVVKAGDVVRVRVMQVDVQRKRIGLTMRLSEPSEKPDTRSSAPAHDGRGRDGGRPTNNAANKRRNEGGRRDRKQEPEPESSMASAFAKALKK
jgi:uncharacterized protein